MKFETIIGIAMKIPTQTRLSQIKEALGPTLKSLGLRPRLCDVRGGPGIRFHDDERQVWSSAMIMTFNTRSYSWDECILCWGKIESFEVGDNGWKFFCEYAPEEDTLGKDAKWALAQIKAALRASNLVYYKDHPRRATSFDLYCVYDELLKVREFATYTCSKLEDGERLAFEDEFGHEWTIDIKQDQATISLDGELFLVRPAKKHEHMARQIGKQLEAFSAGGLKL
ncbi:hypothetical protein HFO86_14950 [Rhizobium leguminosarum]|uniref:hypothetical protein n=1 Tax=Rhizobium leguminosarum TaxID=384 RepID=UPI001C93C3DE|nr:hypothetical protein [Rhizobium leguminosarum]MBY5471498.1 hypothetical protein [Rhizobium leguminosarum]